MLQPRGRGASTAADGGSMSAMAKFGGDLTMTDLQTSEMVGKGSDAPAKLGQWRPQLLPC